MALLCVIAIAILMPSCIPGRYHLKILRSEKPEAKKEELASNPPAKFKLSFFNIPYYIRKNDCYEAAVGATDEAGVLLKNIATEVTISASTGVVIYSNLKACQTYDSTFEQKVYSISSSSPQATFFFRSDTEGAVLFSASAPESVGLSSAQKPTQASFTAFDGSSGCDDSVLAM